MAIKRVANKSGQENMKNNSYVMKNEDLVAFLVKNNETIRLSVANDLEEKLNTKLNAHAVNMMGEFEKTELRLQGQIELIAKDVKYSRAHNEKQNGTLARHEKFINDFKISQFGSIQQADFKAKEDKREKDLLRKSITVYQETCPALKIAARFNLKWKRYIFLFALLVFAIGLGSASIYHHPEVWPMIGKFLFGWLTKSV